MGRAIVRHPAAFLMDEPLSNLDAKLRVQMRAEIHRLQRELGVTTIYVTHDQVEAMTMGDRVAVMRKGELQQVATPQELYDRPVNLFVAGFIGSPAMNLLEADVERAGDDLVLVLGSQRLQLGDGTPRALADYAGRRIIVGIRPEGLEDAAFDEHRDTQQSLHRARRAPRGARLRDRAAPAHRCGAGPDRRDPRAGPGRRQRARASRPGRRSPRRARGARRPSLGAPGSSPTSTLSVDPESLHFFDPETSLGIYDS